MSLPPSVALELNGKPLVVRKTFIDVDEVPKFVKRNSAPGACQYSAATADHPEFTVHDEPLGQLRLRLLSTVREVGNTDACSCGDVETQSRRDVSDVVSIVSTKVPSEISSSVIDCGSSGSDPNGLYQQGCGYLPRQDWSALGTCSHPTELQPFASGHSQWIAGEEERGDRTTLMFRNLPESFTRYNLEELLNAQGFAARFDFLYLPADLKTGVCFGYAFVNLVTPSDARSFMEHFQGFQEWLLPSSKRAWVHMNEDLQGIGELIERYRNSPLMHRSVPHALRPAIYYNGCETPFPVPTAPLKPPRTKRAARSKVARQ